MILVASVKSELEAILANYRIKLNWITDNQPIPGSYWGEPEAGIIHNQLYIRKDTPLHSALHESCHYICMDDERRAALHTNTGGDYDEENAVCFLQIILSQQMTTIDGFSLCDDMDEWGYTFRLGSAKRWFEEDASDALAWLNKYEILDKQLSPTWKIRH